MLRACGKCGRIHDSSIKCYGSSRLPKTDEQVLRNKAKWHRKSYDIRERSFHLCAICRQAGDYTPKAVEVHHIIKLKDYPQGLLDDSNLICLCVEHHKQADRGEIDIDYLRALADERDGLGGAGNDEGLPPRA